MGGHEGMRAGLGRRGLLAGAAALVAGGLAKLARPERAEAAHFGSDEGFIHAGKENTTSELTTINRVSGNGGAITGRTTSAFDAGVGGENSDSDGWGVYGFGAQFGVGGFSDGPTFRAIGTFGESANGSGVRGDSSSGNGVFGVSTNGGGVRGDSSNGNGLFGVSTNASGVYGFSNYNFGAAGVSNVGVGVYASSGSNWGLHASSPIFAGVFSGAVYVNGNFTVANGAKSAAVKNKRGEHRRVYCQESPEAWFEDFGEATLTNGRAEVALDPEFDDVVKGDAYHVYLTPEGDCRGLYVSRKGPHRFEVRELQGGTSSLPFGYRVVARRLDDVGRRLEKVDVPDFAKVKPPVPPSDLPPAPSRPNRPGR